jgi:hypothetical protein
LKFLQNVLQRYTIIPDFFENSCSIESGCFRSGDKTWSKFFGKIVHKMFEIFLLLCWQHGVSLMLVYPIAKFKYAKPKVKWNKFLIITLYFYLFYFKKNESKKRWQWWGFHHQLHQGCQPAKFTWIIYSHLVITYCDERRYFIS